MKTKPFDLESAKNGAKVVTRDGKPVRILCFDREDSVDRHVIVGLATFGNGEEEIFSWMEDGCIFTYQPSEQDLVMAIETVERYAIVGKNPSTGEYYTNGCLYESESCAHEALRMEREALEASFCTVVGIVEVEIEV